MLDHNHSQDKIKIRIRIKGNNMDCILGIIVICLLLIGIEHGFKMFR